VLLRHRHAGPRRGAARSRRGFALALALVALVVIGALIAGVFFASTQEYRVGRNTLMQQRAFATAEYGVNAVTRDWDGTAMTAMTMGQTAPRTVTVPGSGTAEVRVTRLDSLTWWVTSEGTVGAGSGSARRRTSSVLRLVIPTLNILGAMTVNGSVETNGTAEVHGEDGMGDWPPLTCPPLTGGLPGVVVPPGETVRSRGASEVTGAGSPWTTDAAAGDESLYFESWDELVAASNARLGTGGTRHPFPSTTGLPARCNTADSLNWGDPRRTIPAGPCAGYYPIIYVNGDLRLNSHGVGQGILLVNGSLEISGGFEFYGPVIVRGDFRTTGSGGHIYGALMASRVSLESTVALGGSAEVSYSSCAIDAALRNSARPGLAKQRAWADLY